MYAWEIPQKVVFFEYFYIGLNAGSTVIYNMIFFFKKYKLSTVLGTVIKCPKGVGISWEENTYNEKLCFFYKQYICSEQIFEASFSFLGIVDMAKNCNLDVKKM